MSIAYKLLLLETREEMVSYLLWKFHFKRGSLVIDLLHHQNSWHFLDWLAQFVLARFTSGLFQFNIFIMCFLPIESFWNFFLAQ